MQATHSRFTANIGRARDLRALFLNLEASTAGVLDITDILRASIVSAVSALDTFIHEITRIGMVEIYQNARPKTDAFGRFPSHRRVTLNGSKMRLVGSTVG
jgi:hypothetical protein